MGMNYNINITFTYNVKIKSAWNTHSSVTNTSMGNISNLQINYLNSVGKVVT